MKNRNDISDALDKVLAFSSKLTMMVLKDEKPEQKELENIRKECAIIAQANLYPFDLESDNNELINQIRDFGNSVNG